MDSPLRSKCGGGVVTSFRGFLGETVTDGESGSPMSLRFFPDAWGVTRPRCRGICQCEKASELTEISHFRWTTQTAIYTLWRLFVLSRSAREKT